MSKRKTDIEYNICLRCGGSGQIYTGLEDGDGYKCPACNGLGHLKHTTEKQNDYEKI